MQPSKYTFHHPSKRFWSKSICSVWSGTDFYVDIEVSLNILYKLASVPRPTSLFLTEGHASETCSHTRDASRETCIPALLTYLPRMNPLRSTAILRFNSQHTCIPGYISSKYADTRIDWRQSSQRRYRRQKKEWGPHGCHSLHSSHYAYSYLFLSSETLAVVLLAFHKENDLARLNVARNAVKII